MAAPIAIQLYTVRDALKQDFTGVIRQIADIGYVGVETAGFPGTTPREAKRLFNDLGLAVPSAHLPMPVGADAQQALETAEVLDCSYVVSGLGADQFATRDAIQRACALFNQAHTTATAAGFKFAIHNHWWEFENVDGRFVYQVMLEELDPAVLFELDVYWIQTAGVDPQSVVAELGSRAPLLHIKDGPAVQDAPMVAVGSGVLDISTIIAAGQASTEWLIVELDRCATDMVTAVTQSYQYLVGGGLARGTKG